MVENVIRLDGQVIKAPYSIKDILSIKIQIPRLSGAIDECYVDYSDRDIEINVGDYVHIEGYIRSIMSDDNERIIRNLIVANTISKLDSTPDNFENYVHLKNVHLSKEIDYRNSNDGSGKMVNVFNIDAGEEYGKFRVTAWASSATFVHDKVKPEMNLEITGRIQSHVTNRTNKLVWGIISSKLVIVRNP